MSCGGHLLKLGSNSRPLVSQIPWTLKAGLFAIVYCLIFGSKLGHRALYKRIAKLTLT